MTRALVRTTAFPALLLVGLAGCEAKKSSNPLSPSVAGPIAGVEITTPRLLEPAQGTRLKESQQPIRLLIENSSTTGVRPVAYAFEVASDSAFETKVYARSGVTPGGDGRTSVVVERLESGRQYYWRVRAEDGANSSSYSTSNFEILPKPQLNPPPQHSPIDNATTASRRPELVIGAASRNEAVGNVVYDFQVAADVTFGSIVSAGTRSEAGATTTYAPDVDLTGSTTYYWRVRASDGEVTSGWSAVHAFRTPAAPAPSPGPAPSPAPGGPCNSSSAEAIVSCERAKYGYMGHGELVAFLTAVADSLNRNSIPGGRFGLLLKPTGNNCGGYSCDIICSGNGGSQRQWDVLGDVEGAQSPGWSELPWSHIVVRTCEIR